MNSPQPLSASQRGAKALLPLLLQTDNHMNSPQPLSALQRGAKALLPLLALLFINRHCHILFHLVRFRSRLFGYAHSGRAINFPGTV
jgi:hypothetical protein